MYLILKLLEKVYPKNKFIKDDINGKRFFIVFVLALLVAGIILLLIQFGYLK